MRATKAMIQYLLYEQTGDPSLSDPLGEMARHGQFTIPSWPTFMSFAGHSYLLALARAFR